MTRIAYYRVSAADQSIEAQRHDLGGNFDKEFIDHDVSGMIIAKDRPGFAQFLAYVREGDELHVGAVDRLGRDALDIQATVRLLIDRGVTVQIFGIGTVGRGVGEIIVAVLAQVADMERRRIVQRCESGRAAARVSLATTGKTHHGKSSLGRQKSADPVEVAKWRKDQQASVTDTMAKFGLSRATVNRYCAAQAKADATT